MLVFASRSSDSIGEVLNRSTKYKEASGDPSSLSNCSFLDRMILANGQVHLAAGVSASDELRFPSAGDTEFNGSELPR